MKESIFILLLMLGLLSGFSFMVWSDNKIDFMQDCMKTHDSSECIKIWNEMF